MVAATSVARHRELNDPALDPSEQVGIDLVLGRRFAGIRLGIEGFEPHLTHELAHGVATNVKALLQKHVSDAPGTIERLLGIDSIDAMLDAHLPFGGSVRHIVETGA